MYTTQHPSVGMVLMLVCGLVSTAAGDYTIRRATVDGGGIIRSTGGSYELSATIGQCDAVTTPGDSYTLNGGFWFPVVAGDGNEDGLVDLADYDAFRGCLGGPNGQSLMAHCEAFDTDGNAVVDLADFAAIQVSFTSP